MTNETRLAHPFSLSGLIDISDLRIGLPMWFMDSWRNHLLSDGCRPADALAEYSQVFSAVEGNTTFYGLPDARRAGRWRQLAAEDFRFCFKIPQTISHSRDPLLALQQDQTLLPFLQQMDTAAGLLMLQLPAAFSPQWLPQLQELLHGLQTMTQIPLAVEVRHPAFFDKGRAEQALLRLLADAGADRVIFDSRGLFRDDSTAAAVVDARGKKPRLPVHAVATGNNPVVRFIGHSDWPQNLAYVEQWARKLQQWVSEGRTPWLFIHTAANTDAPQFARWLTEQLGLCLPLWPGEIQTAPRQNGDLFG